MNRCINCFKEMPEDSESYTCKRCMEYYEFATNMRKMAHIVFTDIMEKYFFYCFKCDELRPIIRFPLLGETYSAYATDSNIRIEQNMPILLIREAVLKDHLNEALALILDSLANKSFQELRLKFKPNHWLVYSLDMEAVNESFIFKLTAGWYKTHYNYKSGEPVI